MGAEASTDRRSSTKPITPRTWLDEYMSEDDWHSHTPYPAMYGGDDR